MELAPADGAAVQGQAVIVTGAASGIGRALAIGFAGDGAVVFGVDRDAAGLESLAAEAGVHTVTGDVTDPGVLREAAERSVAATGRVDVLINNAGFGHRGRVADLAVADFEAVHAVHVLGALHGIQAVAGPMRDQGHGRIISVISRAAELCMSDNAAYSSAKAALWALTRTAAAELAGHGILVNCLIPGPTNTAIWGRPRPELQNPEVVYPTALALATLPPDGPNGRVFWDMAEYRMFELTIGRGPFA